MAQFLFLGLKRIYQRAFKLPKSVGGKLSNLGSLVNG